MTTDENILEEMLGKYSVIKKNMVNPNVKIFFLNTVERVTSPARNSVDNLAVQMFCIIVQSNSGLVTKAHELIVKKMHSDNTTEATRAIGVS